MATVKFFPFSAIVLLAAYVCGWDTATGTDVVVLNTPEELHIDNGKVAVRFFVDDGHVTTSFCARENDGAWREVCRSIAPDFNRHPEGNRFFDTSVAPHRYQTSEMMSAWTVASHDDNHVLVRLTGSTAGAAVEQSFLLSKGKPYVHVEVRAELTEPRLDYLMSSVTFRAEKRPEFIHSPTAKKNDDRSGPARNQVIGDHAFHSPAIILQEGPQFAALVPDLHMIDRHRVVSSDARREMNVHRNRFSVPIEDDKYTMPTALDLNVVTGVTSEPVMSYGMMDFVIGHHIRYQRFGDKPMARELSGKQVAYGFDLFVDATVDAGVGYQKVARHLWEKYGHDTFVNERHLAMPFEEYVKTIYQVVSQPMDPEVQAPVPGFANRGVFVDFELNGRPVGGMVSPLAPLGFGDALWNFEFWNNVRDAPGMHYWGTKLKEPELVERAQRIVNLALEAPQNEDGFFSLVYLAARQKWMTSTLGPSPEITSIFAGGSLFSESEQVYSIPAMSKTAAYLLEYYSRCERDQRLIDYLSRYGDGLLARIDERGCIASYYTPDMKPIAALKYSAQPAASMWFLAELYNATQKIEYRQGAEAIAGYIMREILPTQQWVDLEPYYSCGQCSVDFQQDDEQGLPVRGNLSTFWAAKGFAALYRATQDSKYLRAGEQAVDYVSFSQACWNPHYVYTAIPFGGFTVDNVDTATWLDARQCEMVEPFLWYGQTLGRQDLIERGVAAARSSVVLINHPRHKRNGIYRHTNFYGFGLGPENINHEGHNQSAMRTHPSWGECSGIFSGLADAARLTGGGIVDLDNGFAVGTDGINLSLEQHGDAFHVAATGRFAKLQQPWEEPYEIELIVRGEQDLSVHLNGNRATMQEQGDSRIIRCKVAPDGNISLPLN